MNGDGEEDEIPEGETKDTRIIKVFVRRFSKCLNSIIIILFIILLTVLFLGYNNLSHLSKIAFHINSFAPREGGKSQIQGGHPTSDSGFSATLTHKYAKNKDGVDRMEEQRPEPYSEAGNTGRSKQPFRGHQEASIGETEMQDREVKSIKTGLVEKSSRKVQEEAVNYDKSSRSLEEIQPKARQSNEARRGSYPRYEEEVRNKEAKGDSQSSSDSGNALLHNSDLSTGGLPGCPDESPHLRGFFQVNLTLPTDFEEVEHAHQELFLKRASPKSKEKESKYPKYQKPQHGDSHDGVPSGGCWRPSECRQSSRIAVLVPLQARVMQLSIFLNNMHLFLQRQNLDYCIIVIEQTDDDAFNRGILLNIGLLELAWMSGLDRDGQNGGPGTNLIQRADKDRAASSKFDCIVLHDVELLPENDKNLYHCINNPLHVASAINIYDYEMPFSNYFGGVILIPYHAFRKANGMSNRYFGVSGVDENFRDRLKAEGFTITRISKELGRYQHISSDDSSGRRTENSPKQVPQEDAQDKSQGLNDISDYKVVQKEHFALYSWILVRICNKPSVHFSCS